MASIFLNQLLYISEVRGFRKSVVAPGTYEWWQEEISSSPEEPESLQF